MSLLLKLSPQIKPAQESIPYGTALPWPHTESLCWIVLLRAAIGPSLEHLGISLEKCVVEIALGMLARVIVLKILGLVLRWSKVEVVGHDGYANLGFSTRLVCWHPLNSVESTSELVFLIWLLECSERSTSAVLFWTLYNKVIFFYLYCCKSEMTLKEFSGLEYWNNNFLCN